MSYNLKKLSLAGLGDFFEQSNNTDMFTVAIERFYNNIDLSTMRPTLLMEFASGHKDKFMLYSNTFDDYIIVSRKVTKAMQCEAGVAKCQISFESGGDIATSDIFEIEIASAIHDKTEDENPYIPTIVADFNDSLGALSQTVDEQVAKEAEDISTLTTALNAQVEKEAEDVSTLTTALNAQVEEEAEDISTLTTALNAQVAKEAEDISTLTTALNAQVEKEAEDVSTLTTALNAQVEKEAEDISTLTTALNAQVAKEAEDYENLDIRVSDIEEELTNVTETVTCDHELEITGQTGDECGLAIDDQQVLIKKLYGKNMRRSPNLIDRRSLSFQGSKAQIDILNKHDDGSFSIYRRTTTELIKIYWRKYIPKGFYSFCLNNNSTGYGCKIYAFDGTNNIQLCDDSVVNAKVENVEFPNGAIYICYEFKAGWRANYIFKPMLVSGPTIEADNFIQFDDSLVCSSADFLSIGRNYFGKDGEAIPVIPNAKYSVNERAFIRIYDSKDKFITGGEMNGSFTTPSNAAYLKVSEAGENLMLYYGDKKLPYEPYKKDYMSCGIELGEWDYIEDNRLVQQTSDPIVIDGTSNFVANIVDNCLIFNIETYTFDQYSIVASSFPAASSDDTTDPSSYGFFFEDEILKLRVESTLSKDDWNNYFRKFPETLVFKTDFPYITDIETLPGFYVWKDGMQKQIPKPNRLPYTIEKEYRFSTKSQILANMEVDRKQQTFISDIKNKLEAENISFNNVQAKYIGSAYGENSGLTMNNDEFDLNINGQPRAVFATDRTELYTMGEDCESLVFYAEQDFTAMYGPFSSTIYFDSDGINISSENSINISSDTDVTVNGLSVTQEIKSLKDSVAALETKNASLETTVTTLQTQLTSLEERIAALEKVN